MGRVQIEILKQRIVDMYDPDELVDILHLSSTDIVEAFEDVVLENSHLFFADGEDTEGNGT